MSETQSPQLSHIAPVFRAIDLAASVAYYRDKLLFEIRFEWKDSEAEPVRYAILGRDGIELHLTASPDVQPSVAYCFVEDVAAYYTEVQAAGANITEAIADQPWEMREFETKDPDGNLLIFGEHLSRLEG
ncbi:bleomycin resistance protein [Roseibium sp.]|uniref:bleomycin resistance protein n=1 Tax=Roseibium sp. TaxID=1936156 RepID=UPI003BAFA9BD